MERQDVGRIGEEVRPKIFALGVTRDLAEIGLQLLLLGAPGEIGIGLGEAELRQGLHDFWPRERFCQEDHGRLGRLNFTDQPLPERKRLGMRVVDPEDTHALLDPEQHDVAQGRPQTHAVATVEIRIDNVLVLFGRVLGILDRAVGPPLEPFGMLLEPWMVGRALHREVERDFHAVRGAGAHEAPEVGQRAEFGVDRVMAAFRRADGVGAAGVARRGAQRIVAPLAIGMPDGMDRREIDNIEAEAGDLRQTRDAIIEGAVAAGDCALTAGDHLVPGAGAGERHVGIEGKYLTAGQVRPECLPGYGGDII